MQNVFYYLIPTHTTDCGYQSCEILRLTPPSELRTSSPNVTRCQSGDVWSGPLNCSGQSFFFFSTFFDVDFKTVFACSLYLFSQFTITLRFRTFRLSLLFLYLSFSTFLVSKLDSTGCRLFFCGEYPILSTLCTPLQ